MFVLRLHFKALGLLLPYLHSFTGCHPMSSQPDLLRTVHLSLIQHLLSRLDTGLRL